MSFSLDALLSLVGHLDDAPGFDTPRERFRRFLLERVTDLPTARALIEDCQRSVGEQRHRALQDLITAAGRLMEFDVTFAPYDQPATDSEVSGRWRSRGLLDAALEVRTEQNASATLERLAHAAHRRREPSIGLCILAQQFVPRTRLDQQLAAHLDGPDIRVVSVRSILTLAALVSAGSISHVEVVELLRSSHALDSTIERLNRPVTAADAEPSFWVATVRGDEMATPEQLLESVIVQRRVLATFRTAWAPCDGAPGDWVCFFVEDQGVVGHAQLASVIADTASVVRDGERYHCVYRLTQVSVYAQPIVHAFRASRPVTGLASDASRAGAFLMPIGRQDFLALTSRPEPTTTEMVRSASA